MIISAPKVFLFGFNPSSLSREQVRNFLNRNDQVLNWITLLSGQAFVVCDLSASELASTIRDEFPGELIFVTEVVQPSTDGWLPKEIWDFINDPRPSAERSESVFRRKLGF